MRSRTRSRPRSRARSSARAPVPRTPRAARSRTPLVSSWSRQSSRFSSLVPSCLHHAIAQHAEAADFELDHVAGLEEACLLEPAAVPDGTGAEEFTCMQRLVGRDVRDDVLELVLH